MNCSCFAGTAIESSDGSCTCVFPDTSTTNPVTPIQNEPLPTTTTSRQLVMQPKPQMPASLACAALDAPSGYHYVWNGTACVLEVDYGATPVQTAIPQTTNTTPATSTTATNVSATINSFMDKLKTAYAGNKQLFVIGGVAVGWYLLNGKSGGGRRSRRY